MTRDSVSFDDLIERVLLLVVGGVVAAGTVLWGTGQLAGRLFGGAWPPVTAADMGGIVTAFGETPADPAQAWPPAARALLPGPFEFYAVLFALVLAAAVLFVVALQWRAAVTRGRSARS